MATVVPGDLGVDPPEYLDVEMIAVWSRLAPDLEQKGVLTAWDADTFAAYCVAVVIHRRALEQVQKDGLLVPSGRGGQAKHPALQIVRDQASTMTMIGGRFGLNHADRRSFGKLGGVGEQKSVAAELLS